MRAVKYVLAAVVTLGIIIAAFQAYSIKPMATHPAAYFAPSASGSINYPNPISQNVTLTGVMTDIQVAPACSLSYPPCAISDTPLYYITVNGWNYRLIFSNKTVIPQNRAIIIVTGIFVTPSTYKASQWTPQLYFRGDIYVIYYVYGSPYQ